MVWLLVLMLILCCYICHWLLLLQQDANFLLLLRKSWCYIKNHSQNSYASLIPKAMLFCIPDVRILRLYHFCNAISISCPKKKRK